MDTITAYIDFHDDDAGVLHDADGWIIGTYTVASRFRQKPGQYATIHARIDGKRYEGTKFERSRRGQVRLSRTPWNDDADDGPQESLAAFLTRTLTQEATS